MKDDYFEKLSKKYPFGGQPIQTARVDPNVRFVYLNRLSVEDKKKRWNEIKINNPAYADLLTKDSFFKELISTFNAEIFEEVSR